MAQVSLGLRLDEELVKQIDAVRGIVPRAAWIARACRRDLAKGAPPEAVRTAAVVATAGSLVRIGGKLPGGRDG
jgi:hypothetical protein